MAKEGVQLHMSALCLVSWGRYNLGGLSCEGCWHWPRGSAGETQDQMGAGLGSFLSRRALSRANGTICGVRKGSHVMAPEDKPIWNDAPASNWE